MCHISSTVGQSIATETTTLRVKLYKPASVKEVVTTKKQPLAQRPLLQDNLTQGQQGETNANKKLLAPITQLPVTHSNAAPRLVQTLSESMGGRKARNLRHLKGRPLQKNKKPAQHLNKKKGAGSPFSTDVNKVHYACMSRQCRVCSALGWSSALTCFRLQPLDYMAQQNVLHSSVVARSLTLHMLCLRRAIPRSLR